MTGIILIWVISPCMLRTDFSLILLKMTLMPIIIHYESKCILKTIMQIVLAFAELIYFNWSFNLFKK